MAAVRRSLGNGDANNYGTQTASTDSRILTPDYKLTPLQMLSKAYDYGLTIPTPDDIWRPPCGSDDPIGEDMILTFYDNTKLSVVIHVFHASALTGGSDHDDLKLAPIESISLNSENYTASIRLDDNFELALMYTYDINGRKVSNQYPAGARVTVKGGKGDFKAVFSGRYGHNMRGTLVANTQIPQSASREVRITKSDSQFGAEIGVYKNNKLILVIPFPCEDTLCKFELPESYAVGAYTYRYRDRAEVRIGNLVSMVPGEILWIHGVSSNSYKVSTTANNDVLYIPSEREMQVILAATGMEADD